MCGNVNLKTRESSHYDRISFVCRDRHNDSRRLHTSCSYLYLVAFEKEGKVHNSSHRRCNVVCVCGSMINSGAFQTVVDIASAAGADVSSLEAIPASIMAITPMSGVLSVVERAFGILLHIGLSIMVFNAVRRSKIGYYLLAILLHALYDVRAALYQTGVLNIYIVEVMIAVYSVLFFVIVIRTLYKRGDSISASPAPDCQK